MLVTLTAIAVALGLFQTIGFYVHFLLLLGVVIAVGVSSHKADRVVPFWQCVGAGLIAFFLVTNLSLRFWTEQDVVGYAVLIGFGLWFSYSSIRRGYWATKLLSVPFAIFYMFIMYGIAALVIFHWDFICDYWFGR